MWWRLETAEAAITGPWWTPDSTARHDLPGRFRLEWIVGTALTAALLKSVLDPREELSAYLLTSAAVAFLSSLAWGRSGTPNSYRYTYLSTTTALAAASGVLWLLSAVTRAHRRPFAYLVFGGFAISGALSARDALLIWPANRATFDGFGGGDTLIGQAASRWDHYGTLRIEASVGGSLMTCESVRSSRIDPYGMSDLRPAKPFAMSIRIVGPAIHPNDPERVVERIRDDWGREYGQVLAKATNGQHAQSHEHGRL
jgi:hypothetical protein